MTTAHGTRVGRLVELESLRGVAAASILVFHCWLFTSAAVLTWNLGPFSVFMQPLQSGVTLFFVLSGFLLYRPMASVLLSGGADVVAIRGYFRNRALRILPAYAFVLVLTGLVLRSAVVRASGHGVSAGGLDGRTLISDLLLVQTYRPSSIWSGILPAWSLSVEVAFYVLLPFLAYAASRLIGRLGAKPMTAAVAPVAAMLILGLVGKVAVSAAWGAGRVSGSDWHAVFDRSLLTHADLFGFGMAAGLVFALTQSGERSPAFLSGGTLGRILAYLGLPTLFLGFYFLPPYLYDTLVALFAAALLLRVTAKGADGGGGRRFLRHPWAIACGRVSYGVFLWNFPVLTFLAQHGLLAGGHGALAFLRNLTLAVLAVGLLSALTYRFVEAPALQLKSRRAAARGVPIPAG